MTLDTYIIENCLEQLVLVAAVTNIVYHSLD